MSAYPAATFLPLLSCPARQVMDALTRVLRDGVPEHNFAFPAWLAGEGCPEDHPFLPPGCQLLRSDRPDEAEGDAVIIHQNEAGTRRAENDPRYWLVPVSVGIYWTRLLTGAEEDVTLRFIEQYLTIGFAEPDTDPVVIHQARHYLSYEDLHVFELRDIKAGFYRNTPEGARTSLEIEFTLFCAGKQLPET